jgi:hypothetical protein
MTLSCHPGGTRVPVLSVVADRAAADVGIGVYRRLILPHGYLRAESQEEPDPSAERLAYSVDEAAHLTGLSRDLLYDKLRRGNPPCEDRQTAAHRSPAPGTVPGYCILTQGQVHHGCSDYRIIRGSMHPGSRQRVADSDQASAPWRLSRSVIDSVGPAGAEFARNADSGPPRHGPSVFDVQPGDLSTAGHARQRSLDVIGTGSLGRVEVTDRDDMPPGLHDPRAGARRAGARRAGAVPGPSAAGAVHEAAGQWDAVSCAVARGKPVATSVVIPR